MTYDIVRFHFNADSEIIKKGLTLEDAQAWCRREETHGKDEKGAWFDGYTEQ